ncbi:hypothetical protein SAMN05444166_6021 [Singulisphaera sp. GP187]|uniref:DUF2946 family protein n=1 Tax=Singulisphaera sp. GP187 TaxID=1882752 RepID=UPI000925F0A5|nr:DUF2946 family protein [Singulisphaera sp. GP187]SIO59353.1 hypothetical protein SAMN05444166_6021 [Singulisphaera sp. GP187]
MVIHRGSLTRLAVLLSLSYGTIALGGSSFLHSLVDRSVHIAVLGSDHEPGDQAASLSLSHSCPLCDFLSQGQIPTAQFVVAGAVLVLAREVDKAPVVSIVNAPLSTRPRAPPR